AITHDPIAGQLKRDIFELEKKLTTNKALYNPGAEAKTPNVKGIEKVIETTKKDLEKRIKELVNESNARLDSVDSSGKDQNQRHKDGLIAFKKELEKQVAKFTDEAQRLNKSTLEVVSLKEEVKQKEMIA